MQISIWSHHSCIPQSPIAGQISLNWAATVKETLQKITTFGCVCIKPVSAWQNYQKYSWTGATHPGAGRKTRQRCRLLLEQGFIPIAWVDIDPKKIGHQIKSVPVVEPAWLLQQHPKPLVLVYVRNHGARGSIQAFLAKAAYRRGRDFLLIG
jgi:hypothetical protein